MVIVGEGHSGHLVNVMLRQRVCLCHFKARRRQDTQPWEITVNQEISLSLSSQRHSSSIEIEVYSATDLHASKPSMPKTVSTSYPARMSHCSSRTNLAGL